MTQLLVPKSPCLKKVGGMRLWIGTSTFNRDLLEALYGSMGKHLIFWNISICLLTHHYHIQTEELSPLPCSFCHFIATPPGTIWIVLYCCCEGFIVCSCVIDGLENKLRLITWEIRWKRNWKRKKKHHCKLVMILHICMCQNHNITCSRCCTA